LVRFKVRISIIGYSRDEDNFVWEIVALEIRHKIFYFVGQVSIPAEIINCDYNGGFGKPPYETQPTSTKW